MNTKKVIVVGGGPAGMFAAWNIAETSEVHLFEKSSSLGRKLLVAGKGGLNITNHSSERTREAYFPEGFMDRALAVFNNEALRNWLNGIGIPTYVGSSGKVFPQKGIKASEVVQRMTNALLERSVTIHLNHKLTGFTTENICTFQINPKGKSAGQSLQLNEAANQISEMPQTINYSADYCVLALGGASWPQTGSDGHWVNMFRENGMHTLPFQPSNCGINIEWPDTIRQYHSGKPLKNIVISVVTEGGETDMASQVKVKMNEALITDDGLEGAAVYSVVPTLRSCFAAGISASVSIDFKPLNTSSRLLKKLSAENLKRAVKHSNASVPDYKSLLSLKSEHMALIKAFTSQEVLHSKEQFCKAVKNLIIPVRSLRPMEEAISVVGGISIDDINDNFSLKSYPSVFVIGEMVNWDAPTGGFLLQGCFSMAALVGQVLIH